MGKIWNVLLQTLNCYPFLIFLVETDVLIEGGADIHYRGNRGWTCLHWAAWCGHISVGPLVLM